MTSTVRNAYCETIVQTITDAMAISNGVPLILEACRTASVLTCRAGPHHARLWAYDIDAILLDIISRRCSYKQSSLCNKEILEVDQHVWDIFSFLVAYLPQKFRPKTSQEFCRLNDFICSAWYAFLIMFCVVGYCHLGGTFGRYLHTGITEVSSGIKWSYHFTSLYLINIFWFILESDHAILYQLVPDIISN